MISNKKKHVEGSRAISKTPISMCFFDNHFCVFGNEKTSMVWIDKLTVRDFPRALVI